MSLFLYCSVYCEDVKIFLLWAACKNKACRVNLLAVECEEWLTASTSYEDLVDRKGHNFTYKPVLTKF
jgi:hypothetical protein